MPYAPELSGPHDPLLVTPPRRRRSIRRTTSIDTARQAGGAAADIEARARDLLTEPDGTAVAVGHQRLHAMLDQAAAIQSLDADPGLPGLDRLRGRTVGPGFRRVTLDLVDDLVPASLLAHLLDDWPGAQLVSGYAMQRTWTEPGATVAPASIPSEHLAQMSDICAGWAASGSIMVTLGRTGIIPTPLGPSIALVEAGDDELAWHALPPLAPRSTRRRRRIDLWVQDDATFGFETHFRDSYGEDVDTQSSVHEYVVTGTVVRRDLVLSSISAEVRVLPWQECPSARASADRLAGTAVSGLRPLVRNEFSGTSTCTHLNDTLRSLEDITALAADLEQALQP